MALSLSIVKSPAGVSLASSEKSFGADGGSIGRGEGNDWVLGDPERFLSSRHCSISCQDGLYYLTDTSTNGTFVNGAPEPLGKGGKVLIKDGDTIEVGDYQFRAAVGAGASSSDSMNPFADTGMPSASASIIPDDDPFATPSGANNSLEGFAEPLTGNGGGGFDPFSGGGNVSLSPDPANVDPLAALDGADSSGFSGGGASNNLGGGQIPDVDFLADPKDDLLSDDGQSFIGDGGYSDPFSGGESHSDRAGALNQAISIPDAKSANVIPDDWNDDLLGGGDPLSNGVEPSGNASPPPSFPPEQRPQNMQVSDAHRSIPLTDPPKMPPSRSIPEEGSLEDLLAARPPEEVEPVYSAKPSAPEPVQRVQPTPAAPAEPSRPRQTTSPSSAANKATGSEDALLEAMGISSSQLSAEEVANIHQVVGTLIPVIINGMMQVLRSRASIKNEFRMNVTTIQPIENNPLKFSANAAEAIENMFVRNSSAYMAPGEAFQEGFDGIGEHQVAIIAGIRAAFKSMMDRFNPELLERQFDKQNKGVVLPGMQKAKYWNSYSDFYKGFVDNMENTFQYLFGDEFVQAYEDQLRRLAVERKKRQK